MPMAGQVSVAGDGHECIEKVVCSARSGCRRSFRPDDVHHGQEQKRFDAPVEGFRQASRSRSNLAGWAEKRMMSESWILLPGSAQKVTQQGG